MLAKNIPSLTIFIGNSVIGYMLNFFWRSLSPISCQFDFDIILISFSVLLYFLSAIFAPILIRKENSRNYSIEHLSKLTSYISVFSWIPLIVTSTNFLHILSFEKFFSFVSFAVFGATSGLLQSFLHFFTFISPVFEKHEKCSIILNSGFLNGIFFSELILFLTNWQIATFFGFYISYLFSALLSKLFEDQKSGKNSLQLPAAMQISIDVFTITNAKNSTTFYGNYLFIFILLFVKYFSGKCYFELFIADFVFELNYSQLILDFIFAISTFICFYISEYFSLKQTFPVTSITSITSIFAITYFTIHQNKYEWNKSQMFLILGTLAWSVMYTMNFMMIPYVKICDSFKKSTLSIQKSFIFSSYDWLMRILSHLFFFYLGNYISDVKFKMYIICLMNILCAFFGYLLIRTKKELNDDLETAKPLRNL